MIKVKSILKKEHQYTAMKKKNSQPDTYLRSGSKANVLLIDTSRLSGWIRLNISTTGMPFGVLVDTVFTRTHSSNGTSSRTRRAIRSLNDGTLWRCTLMACTAKHHEWNVSVTTRHLHIKQQRSHIINKLFPMCLHMYWSCHYFFLFWNKEKWEEEKIKVRKKKDRR
jgi:hypothetical protein